MFNYAYYTALLFTIMFIDKLFCFIVEYFLQRLNFNGISDSEENKNNNDGDSDSDSDSDKKDEKKNKKKIKKYSKQIVNEIQNLEEKYNTNFLIICDEFWNDDKKLPDNLKNIVVDIEFPELFFYFIAKAYADKKSLSLIIYTEGGNISSTDFMFHDVLDYPYGVNGYVPYYAMSAGAMISLACDNIYMNSYSCLGPTDPQISVPIGNYDRYFSVKQYSDLLKYNKDLPIKEKYYLVAKEAETYHRDTIKNMRKVFEKRKIKKPLANKLTKLISSGDYIHSRPLKSNYLNSNGFKINGKIPEDINNVFEQFISFKKLFI